MEDYRVVKERTKNILRRYEDGECHVSSGKIYQKIVHWSFHGFSSEHNNTNQSIPNQIYNYKDGENYHENNFCVRRQPIRSPQDKTRLSNLCCLFSL